MDSIITKKQFKDIDLDDPFFNTLKESYKGFVEWFRRKNTEYAYTSYDNGRLIAFMYTKVENNPVTDITPVLNVAKILKIGTFKINAHNTKLGERYIKKVFDEAITQQIKHIYVTVFEQHRPLIQMLEKYGFNQHGTKKTANGTELVFLKDFVRLQNDIYLDYPVVNIKGYNIWMLGIYPMYHSRLFPDSLLRTEDASIITDLTHTNSINKIYIARMRDMQKIKPKDILVIYRTAEKDRDAEYSSVATSICIVDDIKCMAHFSSENEFIEYCNNRSIFSDSELKKEYQNNKNYVIKMTYNIALPKRIVRNILINDVGISRDAYAGLMEISKEQFNKICHIGKVYEGVTVD